MEDPYERKRELEIKERMAHHAKLGDKNPFRTTEFGGKAFVKDKLTYGLDNLPKKHPRPETKYNIMKHESAFKPSHPSKSGYNGYLNKFPAYKSDPIRVIKRLEK
mmetsp:Transcript_3840/g.580  ORF Transcript_3840/g.580 Transcript_3840/m.580 type:complete len:105 (+) Transcript_3840:231-545(+)